MELHYLLHVHIKSNHTLRTGTACLFLLELKIKIPCPYWDRMCWEEQGVAESQTPSPRQGEKGGGCLFLSASAQNPLHPAPKKNMRAVHETG